MKKIEITDGINVRTLETESEDVKKLTKKILDVCNSENYSYVQKNKALYLADKELYHDLIIAK